MPPLVSVLMVNYQSSSLALQAVESLLAQEARDFPVEVILVDNCSEPHERAILKEARLPSRVKLHFLDKNTGYGRGNNYAYAQSSGRHVLVLNPDTWVYPGALRTMADYLERHHDCAAVGPRTYWDEAKTFILPPSEVQSSTSFLAVHWGHHFHALGHFLDRYWLDRSLRHWRQRTPSEVEMLSGGCFMAPRRIIEKIGLFDPAFKLYFEDTDWCRRARLAGYRLVFLPEAEIAHFYNQSGQKRTDAMEVFTASRSIYFQKYESRLQCRLFPVLNERILKMGAKDKGGGLPYSFADLGILQARPPLLKAPSEDHCERYLLQIAPGPLFIPAFGAFFREPAFQIPDSVWRRLGPGRYFARWLSLPEKRAIGRWTWEKRELEKVGS